MSKFNSPAPRNAETVRPVALRPVKPSGILHFTLGVTASDYQGRERRAKSHLSDKTRE